MKIGDLYIRKDDGAIIKLTAISSNFSPTDKNRGSISYIYINSPIGITYGKSGHIFFEYFRKLTELEKLFINL